MFDHRHSRASAIDCIRGSTDFPAIRRRPAVWFVERMVDEYTTCMFRIAVIIVLAADLLVCPIRCAVHASDEGINRAADVEVGVPATACCCDCEGREQLPASERPISDPIACCEDCFCDGAILPDVAGFEPGPSIVWWSSRSAKAGALLARCGGPCLRVINPPPKPGGIDARILYQSLQI